MTEVQNMIVESNKALEEKFTAALKTQEEKLATRQQLMETKLTEMEKGFNTVLEGTFSKTVSSFQTLDTKINQMMEKLDIDSLADRLEQSFNARGLKHNGDWQSIPSKRTQTQTQSGLPVPNNNNIIFWKVSFSYVGEDTVFVVIKTYPFKTIFTKPFFI